MGDKNSSSFVINNFTSSSKFLHILSPEKRAGHHSEIKRQSPCENEYKKYCSNGSECCHLVVEDIVGCTCKGCMEETVVKNTCGGDRLDTHNREDEKIFWSKSDETKNFQFKMMLFKKAQMKKLSFLRSKLTQNAIFLYVITSSKSDFFKRSQLKNWFLNDLSSSWDFFKKKIYSKYDNTKTFQFKIWRVVKFLFQNLIFYLFFRFEHKNGLHERRMWEVCNLSLHDNRCSLSICCFFY